MIILHLFNSALQADMQMAVACSLSLQHEEHIKKGEDEEIVKVIQGQMEAQNRELESVLGRETPQPPLVSKSRASHKKRYLCLKNTVFRPLYLLVLGII